MRKLLPVAIAAVLVATSAHATLTVRDLATAGDGLLTYDSDTGLEWLDLTASMGETGTQATANHAGFTLAGEQDVRTLYGHFGISVANSGYYDYANGSSVAAGQQLAEMMGYSVAAFGLIYDIYGQFARPNGTQVGYMFTEVRVPPASTAGTFSYATLYSNNINSSASLYGNFLYREAAVAPSAAPEPGTWLSMLAGFGGLGIALRRRRRAAIA